MSEAAQGLAGVRNDLKEIGGSLKSGFSKLRNSLFSFKNDVVVEEAEIIAGDVAGISEETVKTVKFVKEICSTPECWTRFPLPLQEEFIMSEAQREHVVNMEYIVPSVGDVRSQVSECVGEGQFWMVYFVMLLPLLSQLDAQILSTPQIVETRNLLMQKLKSRSKMRVDTAETSNSHDASLQNAKISGTRKENISSGEDKVGQIVNSMNRLEVDDEENAGKWFEDSDVSTTTSVGNKRKHGSEEDASFSDLDYDYNDLSSRSSASIRRSQGVRVASPSGSSDWVQLNETTGGVPKARQSLSQNKDSDVESTEWLEVDDDSEFD